MTDLDYLRTAQHTDEARAIEANRTFILTSVDLLLNLAVAHGGQWIVLDRSDQGDWYEWAGLRNADDEEIEIADPADLAELEHLATCLPTGATVLDRFAKGAEPFEDADTVIDAVAALAADLT